MSIRYRIVGIFYRPIPVYFAGRNSRTLDQLPRRTAAFVLILAIGTFVLNRTLFIHVHMVSDGSFIVHAHPSGHNDGQERGKDHSHTGGELLILQHQDLLYGFDETLVDFSTTEFGKEEKAGVIQRQPHSVPSTRTGRAPPFS